MMVCEACHRSKIMMANKSQGCIFKSSCRLLYVSLQQQRAQRACVSSDSRTHLTEASAIVLCRRVDISSTYLLSELHQSSLYSIFKEAHTTRKLNYQHLNIVSFSFLPRETSLLCILMVSLWLFRGFQFSIQSCFLKY